MARPVWGRPTILARTQEGYVAAPASDPRQLHTRLHLSGLGDVYCVPALRPLRGTELA